MVELAAALALAAYFALNAALKLHMSGGARRRRRTGAGLSVSK